MSGEYGILGEIKMQEWNTGLKRTRKALDRGEIGSAIVEAKVVIDSYLKHCQATEKWVKISEIIAVITIIVAVLGGIASGSVFDGILCGIPGAVVFGLLQMVIVDKRMGLENDFHNSYEELRDFLLKNDF